MDSAAGPGGRRARAKEDKRQRITDAARALFAERGVNGVTTQQIADQADVAIGTLFRYAATKAELLIMVQNDKFAAAIDEGLARLEVAERADADGVDRLMAVISPVVRCIREQPENGRTYLHELVFGDPDEPNRREGLALSARLEDGLAGALAGTADGAEASVLARVVTSVVHVGATATLFLHRSCDEVLEDVRRQIAVVLALRLPAA